MTKKTAKLKKKQPYIPPYLRDEEVKILVLHEKHGNRHFIFRTKSDLDKIADKIVEERCGGLYEWYTREEVEASDARDNWEFLQFRDFAEYEGMTIEYPEEV